MLTEKEKEEIAQNNYSLIFYVVKLFQNSGISYDELVSIAMVGYAKALNAFDTSRKVKFSTYAINCIRNEILFFLRKEKATMMNTVSLNTVLSKDNNGNNLFLEETVSNRDLQQLSIEEAVIQAGDEEILRETLKTLSPKEVYIITYRYGLDRGIIKTQKEIAENIKMSQANVSKLETNILEKIRITLKSNKKFSTRDAVTNKTRIFFNPTN